MNVAGGLRWRAVSLVAAVCVIVALTYAVSRNSSLEALNAATWVNHSAEVKSLTFHIAYLSRDRETLAYRLLEGETDPKIPTRIKADTEQIPALLAELRAITSDNGDQQLRIGALETTVSGRSVLIDSALTKFAAGDRVGAVHAMHDASTLFLVLRVIDDIAHAEDNLLEARRQNALRQQHNSQWVMGVSAVAEVLLLGIIVLVSERQIAQRLRAEASENQAVRRSRLILQAVREPIALLDSGLRVLLVNNAFSELYGFEHEVGTLSPPLGEIGAGAWDDVALQQRLRDVLLRNREMWDHEVTQRTVDGVERHLQINARPLEDQGDEPALLLTVSDMTVRTLAERRVVDLNRQLAGKVEQVSDVNRELEAFSYSVSHDLRAPLRHIAGFAAKLEKHLGEQIDERSTHYLSVITTSAQRMAQLIDDLLVFSRLGRGAMRLQSVDMQSLVSEARALAESDADANRRIDWQIEPLPIVVGDDNMLRMVWQNLLGNAVKYTGKKPQTTISVSAQQTDEGYEFTVADNGAGFDMRYADKLFGVFQRLHREEEFEGTGIGLANVKRIVERHGGRVWAEGELDRGATFFALPAA